MNIREFDLSTNLVRLIFLSLVGAFLFIIVNGLANLSIPFFFAFIIAFLLYPLVDFFESLGLPRLLAVLLVITILFLAIYGFVTGILPILTEEIKNLTTPEKIQRYDLQLDNFLVGGISKLKENLPAALTGDLKSNVLKQRIYSLGQSMLPRDFSFIGDLLTFVLITPVVLILLLLQGDAIYKRIMSMVPNRYFEMVLSVANTIRMQIRKYLKGLSLQWLIFGTFFSFTLWIVGMPYAIALAFFAATFNVIPYVGPALGVIPAIVIAMLEPDLSTTNVLIAFGATQLLDNAFTQPVVLAGSVKLHPLIAILTLITLQQFLGVIGMVIAIPLASIMILSIEIMYRQLKAYGLI